MKNSKFLHPLLILANGIVVFIFAIFEKMIESVRLYTTLGK